MDSGMDSTLARLEQVLREQAHLHGLMLELLGRKRQALGRASHGEVTACCREENVHVQRISELEKERLQLVADLTLRVRPQAPQPLRLQELAELLPEPARGRLLVLRHQLHGQMEKVRGETATTRRATELLLQHMQGLMRKVGAACTGVSVYGRQGLPPPSAMAVSTFNMTA